MRKLDMLEILKFQKKTYRMSLVGKILTTCSTTPNYIYIYI